MTSAVFQLVLLLSLLPPGAGTAAAPSLSLDAPLAALLADGAARPDPDPEPPPVFPRGFRPDPWETWEVPHELRRITLGLHVGTFNFFRTLTVLKMDNPGLVLASSEYVEYQSLWVDSEIGFTLSGTLSLTPLLQACAETSLFSFRRQVSPPSIYVTYADADNNERLLSTGNLTFLSTLLFVRLDFPVGLVLFEPNTLLRFFRAPASTGFVPFVMAGVGLVYHSGSECTVYRIAGGVPVNEKRPLLGETVGLTVAAGFGLEYRLSFLNFSLRALLADNGTPPSRWPPYTDVADPFVTYVFELGASASFF